jgi:hypothetical protein
VGIEEDSTVLDHSSPDLHSTEEMLTVSNKRTHQEHLQLPIPLPLSNNNAPESSASLSYDKAQSNARRNTKKVSQPEFPWASVEGILSWHAGTVLLPPATTDLKRNGRYGRKKIIGCLVCAQYETTTSPWAIKQYRASESRNFLAHEESEIHRLAEAKSRNNDSKVTL